MTEPKKIFLLGGTGFIGTPLTRQLTADRQANEVLMLVHRTAPFRQLEQVNTQTGSLSALDLALLDRFRPDTILHLARMSGRGKLGRLLAARRGARANQRIISHLTTKELRPHVIYVSGTLVYGDCGPTLVDEARPLQPIAFDREYIKAEQPWMTALSSGELPVSILRPPWIIGPGSWFADFYLSHIKHHRNVPLFGDGRNLMSLLDVEDCAGLVAHAVRHAQPGQIYNLFAPDACVTQLEFAERLAHRTQTGIRRYTAAELRGKYGQTMLEAFTFSNRAATLHPEFLAGYQFKHPTVDAMIRHNLPSEPNVAAMNQSLARNE